VLSTKRAKDAYLPKVTLDTAMDNSLTRAEISAMRRSYGEAGLVTLPADPFAAFMTWLTEARANPVIDEANAMVLSTLGGDGDISTRTVLLKDVSEGGFTFF
jgi:pyridoxamine 5'-phosphate oxidase